MREKLTAAILILACVMSLASCTVPKTTEEIEDTETETTEEKDLSFSEEKIYENIDKIAAALANCDFEDLSSRCVSTPYEVLGLMPVVEEEDEDDLSYKVTDNMLIVKNMIASTITYKIDETSYKAKVFDKKYSVDVTFSYKDYSKVVRLRDKFLGPADFNTLMAEEERTIDQVFTLEFVKRDNHYLLSNANDLAILYAYDLPELEFMKNHFDMIENSYMTGPGWDPYMECYYDTNTFEFVIELDAYASNYIWRYVYLVSEETEPEWTRLYLSDTIVDKYPTGIHLTYTQEENFSTGFYCFIIYDLQSEQVYGWEFNVYNTDEMIPSISIPEWTFTDVTEATEETEEPD